MTAFLFVLFLVVVAAAVAAAGDRMGHLAARRKIRFGNMRPRNVSTTIAVVTGMVISLVTFLILFGLWADFRDALLKYRTVRDQLGTAQQQMRDAEENAAEAQQRLGSAQTELAGTQQTLSDTRGTLIGVVQELDTANRDLVGLQEQIDELEAREQKLRSNISGYETVEANLRELVEKARHDLRAFEEEVRTYQEGEIVYSRGLALFYEIVSVGQAGQLEGELTKALVRLSDRLSERGLELDSTMGDVQTQFVADYEYGGADHEVVVVFRTARNVLAGGKVLLELQAVPLTPLVEADEELMTVLVDRRQASISWRGSEVAQLGVAQQFDQQSFTALAEELWAVFNTQAKVMGFLPNLSTGEIPNPVESLASVYDDLSTRQRPFILQFVTKEPANALEGLADMNIFVSQWPPEREQE